jgi:hypothetical protein
MANFMRATAVPVSRTTASNRTFLFVVLLSAVIVPMTCRPATQADAGKLRDKPGVFSTDEKKILFMSSYPFRADWFQHHLICIETGLMNNDGTDPEQLIRFNSPGYAESNTAGRGSLAANGAWHSSTRSISVLNLFIPKYETWTIALAPAAVVTRVSTPQISRETNNENERAPVCSPD